MLVPYEHGLASAPGKRQTVSWPHLGHQEQRWLCSHPTSTCSFLQMGWGDLGVAWRTFQRDPEFGPDGHGGDALPELTRPTPCAPRKSSRLRPPGRGGRWHDGAGRQQ